MYAAVLLAPIKLMSNLLPWSHTLRQVAPTATAARMKGPQIP
jgi:hypothetical protein